MWYIVQHVAVTIKPLRIVYVGLTCARVSLSSLRYVGVRTRTGSLPSTLMFTLEKKDPTCPVQLNYKVMKMKEC